MKVIARGLLFVLGVTVSRFRGEPAFQTVMTNEELNLRNDFTGDQEIRSCLVLNKMNPPDLLFKSPAANTVALTPVFDIRNRSAP